MKKIIIIALVILGITIGYFQFTNTKESDEVKKLTEELITYTNATKDNIVVDAPVPSAVVEKEFTVTGKARGPWFFEASFPIEVTDTTGKVLTIGIAQALGEWMTTEFVEFSAPIKVPENYTGKAMLVLKKDNPSGMAEHDASISFPVTIK